MKKIITSVGAILLFCLTILVCTCRMFDYALKYLALTFAAILLFCAMPCSSGGYSYDVTLSTPTFLSDMEAFTGLAFTVKCGTCAASNASYLYSPGKLSVVTDTDASAALVSSMTVVVADHTIPRNS